MKVYLAGPIQGCSDQEAKEWRELAKTLLRGIECLDPMRRDYRNELVSLASATEVVRGDLHDIDESDMVLAYYPRASTGTAMEICYARHSRLLFPKPVLLVKPASVAMSPWLLYHIDRSFLDVKTACEWIVQHHENLPRW